MIALQCCVRVCSTAKWISYMYTYVPSNSPPSPALGHHRAPAWAPCAYSSFPQLMILYKGGYICQCYSLNSSILSFPCHHAYKPTHYVCVSVPAPQISSSVPLSLSSIYMQQYMISCYYSSILKFQGLNTIKSWLLLKKVPTQCFSCSDAWSSLLPPFETSILGGL